MQKIRLITSSSWPKEGMSTTEGRGDTGKRKFFDTSFIIKFQPELNLKPDNVGLEFAIYCRKSWFFLVMKVHAKTEIFLKTCYLSWQSVYSQAHEISIWLFHVKRLGPLASDVIKPMIFLKILLIGLSSKYTDYKSTTNDKVVRFWPD